MRCGNAQSVAVESESVKPESDHSGFHQLARRLIPASGCRDFPRVTKGSVQRAIHYPCSADVVNPSVKAAFSRDTSPCLITR